MPIKATRALLNAALDGSLNQAEFRTDPNFGFKVPVAVPGVDPAILDPRRTWADKQAYDATAARLADLFVENFAQFADHVDDGVRSAAPSIAAACGPATPWMAGPRRPDNRSELREAITPRADTRENRKSTVK